MNKTDPTIHVPGVDPVDHVAVANAINKQLASFSQVQQPLKLDELPAYLPGKDPPPQFHPWEIYSDLKRVSVSKAGGPDNISQQLLKEFAYELSSPVTEIINTSLQQGTVPSQWKQANVIPLPKNDTPFRGQIKTSVTYVKFSQNS